MKFPRRNFLITLSGLTAARGLVADSSSLPSRAYRLEDLPVRVSGGNQFRPVLEGATASGYQLEMHETDLAPGAMPHAAHHHAHVEIFLVREGTVEVTIAGKSSRLGPGSVAYVASGDEHGIRNAGTDHAQYFVIALGRKE